MIEASFVYWLLTFFNGTYLGILRTAEYKTIVEVLTIEMNDIFTCSVNPKGHATTQMCIQNITHWTFLQNPGLHSVTFLSNVHLLSAISAHYS